MLYTWWSGNVGRICLCRRVFLEYSRIVVVVYRFFDVEIVMDGDWYVALENVPVNVIVLE